MLTSCKTFVTRDAARLTQQLSHIIRTTSLPDTLLFSISPSPSLSETELHSIVKIFSEHPKSVGCLSAPVNIEKHGQEKLIPTVCSLSTFDTRYATPFRSTIPGKEPTQVGRWHAFRKRDVSSPQLRLPADSTGIDWESVWARPQDGGNTHSVPELQGLKPQDVRNILYLSDEAPEGLSQYLDRFNRASKIGVIASSTPFVTGRPFTLFSNGQVHSSGAVGICFTGAQSQPDVWFPELQEISTGTLTVTSAEGNLVHTLSDQNPSRLILAALQKTETSGPHNVDIGIKEDQFFLGVFRDGKQHQMYNITAGDPSRGTISLQGDAVPEVGSRVKIYRKDSDHRSSTTVKGGVEVHTVAPEDVLTASSFVEDAGVSVIEGSCLIASENGFIVSRFDGQRCERPWRSTVTGGGASFPFTLC